MSKTNLAGQMTRLLIFVCVVFVGMELSDMHVLAGGMPGLFSNDSSCGNATCPSSAVSECNCPHCREARGSDSRLVRFFKSHTTKTKWAERPPKNSWKCYHPCAPYFQPTFGIHQTSWTILPHDECSVPFAVPPEVIALPTGLKFEKQTPDSVFSSEDRSFFPVQPAAATRAVRHLK